MLLSQRTTIRISREEANIIGHMCYAAYKLWNICNYERLHYKELNLPKYPDWYYQKSAHKDSMWFRSLPSQTAQEVCRVLHEAWKSYFSLVKSGEIENPKPPRFKHEGMAVTYIQNGMVHDKEEGRVRLTLSRTLKRFMRETYGIDANYLFLKNKIFQDIDSIRQIRLYPPEKEKVELIMVYEVPDTEMSPDNGHYLSVDLGLHNLMTCYDSDGGSFILGRKYLSITRYYDKEIARVQSEWMEEQKRQGIRYPKSSEHIRRLYRRKSSSINDYLHKITKYLACYCEERNIGTLIIGDLTNIRKERDLGRRTNQKLHGLPYRQIYRKLEYKLKKKGIRMVLQEESYSSQCSPNAKEVSRKYAEKKKRITRGLYKDQGILYHADAVGAYNIMRKYLALSGKEKELPVSGLKEIKRIKVAV